MLIVQSRTISKTTTSDLKCGMMRADAAEITALSTATWVDIPCSRLGTEADTEAGTAAGTATGTAVVVLSNITNTVNKSNTLAVQ